jgi:glycogen(starch) synthase
VAAEMLVKQAGLAESVRFLGDVDHEMCLALMARSDVFVRPTFRDGDSVSVREAVSMGIPVVASNVGTRPPETLLFEPGDSQALAFQIERALERRPSVGIAEVSGVQALMRLYE